MNQPATRTDRQAAADWRDVRVEIELHDRTVYTLNGVPHAGLQQIKALRAAWQAGKTGGVDLTVTASDGAHYLSFDYEAVARVDIVAR